MNTTRRLPFVNRTNSDELQDLQELCFSNMKQQKPSTTRSSRKDHTRHNAILIRKPDFSIKASDDETASTVSISSLSSDDENVSAKVMSFTSNTKQAPRDNNFASKAVFVRHMIGPAIKVQAAVRGWIQMKKYRQSRLMVAKSQATLLIQSLARGWFARQRRQIFTLEAKLRNIQHCHRVELDNIEAYKQREMKRIYNEIVASVLAEEKRLHELHQSRLKLIAELKESNTRLREDNETLRSASLVVAETNQRSTALLEQTNKNIAELERFIPRVQADLKKNQASAAEWLAGIQEFEQALENYNERCPAEKKIRKLLHITILRLVQAVREGCSDVELAKSIVQMAKKKRKTTSVEKN